MLEMEDALARILAVTPQPKTEVVSLLNAHRRILAESVVANIDLPGFDNSAMDGYAIRAADVRQARSDQPVRLQLKAKVAAGESCSSSVEQGSAIRVFTGSILPSGADGVVMQEDTTCGQPGEILVNEAIKPWENVRFRGEDVKQGSNVAESGEILGPGKLTLLAALGMSQVKVGRAPRVALLATGTELREPGTTLAPGQIYESNRYGLAALLESISISASLCPIVTDTREGTRAALQQAFDQCDAVISSGGVSVGEMDFVKTALTDLGGELQFWRVAIKPGRPFVFGRCQDKLLFGLPGNPVSAFVTFLLLVRPALLRWQGATDLGLPTCSAILQEEMVNEGQRRHYMRVKVDAHGQAFSAGNQGSHVLSSLGAANGLVDVPPKAVLEKGKWIQVLQWEP